MAPKKKGKEKKGKGKKDEDEEEILMIKFFEIKRLRTTYLRQCKHFVTVPLDPVLRRIEKYHNIEYLSSNKSEFIDKIIIDSCQMNCNDMYALSTSFQNFKYLKTLCLWNIQMDKGAFIAIDKFLSRHKFVEIFQFLYCNATVENSIYLASILRNTESLVDVSFDHNPLKGEGIVNLFMGMKENANTKIKKISLRYCEASGEFCEALVPLLGENKTITEMDLSGNFIGQDGVMFLATALMNNNTLKVLNLSSNNITDDQELYGRTLLTPIPSKTNLTAITTATTNVATNPEGAGGLVSGVSATTADTLPPDTSPSATTGIESDKSKVSNLNLSEDNNSITMTTSTLFYLADAVSREESAITHLDLRGNNIGNNGGEIMLQALKTRKALVVAKKKTAPVFICQVTERMKSDIFSKIFDINKFMLEQEKKRGGKKGKKGKGKKK